MSPELRRWRIGPYGVARLPGIGWAGIYRGAAVAVTTGPYGALYKAWAARRLRRPARHRVLDLATGRLLELCVKAETETGVYLAANRRDVEAVARTFREIAREAYKIRKGLGM